MISLHNRLSPRRKSISRIQVLGDVALLAALWLILNWAMGEGIRQWTWFGWFSSLAAILLTWGGSALIGTYRLEFVRFGLRVIARHALQFAVTLICFGATAFLLRQDWTLQGVLVMATAFALLSMMIHAFLLSVLYSRRRKVPLAILGSGAFVNHVVERLTSDAWHENHYDLRGVITVFDGDQQLYACRRLGHHKNLPNILEKERIEQLILVSDDDHWLSAVLDRLAASAHPIQMAFVPGNHEIPIGRNFNAQMQDLPLISMRLSGISWWQVGMKRLIDVVGALGIGLLALPLIVLAFLAIWITSGRPIFYVQERVGLSQKVFRLVKFRSMVKDAEARTGAVIASTNDPRVTPLGRFLRATRIDELPQLWNVLVGEMSLVGPRPERPVFVEQFIEDIPGYVRRFSVKPGLTGLAQIRGGYHTPPAVKIKYDLSYIARYTPALDLRLLVETIGVVLSRRGS